MQNISKSKQVLALKKFFEDSSQNQNLRRRQEAFVIDGEKLCTSNRQFAKGSIQVFKYSDFCKLYHSNETPVRSSNHLKNEEKTKTGSLIKRETSQSLFNEEEESKDSKGN